MGTAAGGTDHWEEDAPPSPPSPPTGGRGSSHLPLPIMGEGGGERCFITPSPTLPHQGGGDRKLVGEGASEGDSTFSVRACRHLASGRRRAEVASNPTGC